MTPSKFYFIIYICLIISFIIGAINDIAIKKKITLNFISNILFIIGLIINIPTYLKDPNLYYAPTAILALIGLCIQAYSQYDNSKKHTGKGRVNFIMLIICIFFVVTVYKIYTGQVVYY